MPGPLEGLRIVEFAGIGPGPFCGMMLADHGAEVIRVDRASGSRGGSQPVTSKDVLARGRKSIAIDLKSPEGVALARKLAASADGIIEGFRPGVMERLGLGPDELLKRQSEARLRPDDRLGADGTLCPLCRARHQLHRARRRSGAFRTRGRQADPADQHGRRFWRRRHDARVRDGLGAARGRTRGTRDR